MSESEGSRTATEDDGKPSESDTIQENSDLNLKYNQMRAEIQEYEYKVKPTRS